MSHWYVDSKETSSDELNKILSILIKLGSNEKKISGERDYYLVNPSRMFGTNCLKLGQFDQKGPDWHKFK